MTSGLDRRFFGYAGWFLASAFFFYAWILRVAPSITVEPIMRDFAVGGAVVGNLSAVYFYSYAALQIPVGLALDRWGPRRVLTMAVLIAGIGSLVFAAAPSVEVAYAGRLLIGAGAGFAFVGALVIAGAWFTTRRFALLSGLSMAIGLLGGVVGQGPLAAVVEDHGWRTYMYALACGALVMAALTWLFTRDRAAPEIAAGVRAEGALRSLVRVARRPQTLLIALFILLVSGPLLAFSGLWGVPFTMQLYGVDKPTAGFAVSLGLFGVAAGGPIWGWVSDRFGRRKLPIVAGSLVAALSLGVALYVPGLPFDLYRILMFLYGLGGSAMIVAYALAREHNADGGVGGALGLVNMCAVLSGAIFQPLIGIVLDWRWDGTMRAGARIYSLDAYGDAFLVLPALYGAGVLIALAIRETYCRPVAVAAA